LSFFDPPALSPTPFASRCLADVVDASERYSSSLGFDIPRLRVLFTRTSDLIQRLQAARRELALKAAINRLDRFHLLILDDLGHVSKDQAKTFVLFELISARYEHHSMLITANQPFGAWCKVFSHPAMTLTAVDRLVNHATIFEINVDSYLRRAELERKQKGIGRPQKHATITEESYGI
jgi:DNA replication protein DnaC